MDKLGTDPLIAAKLSDDSAADASKAAMTESQYSDMFRVEGIVDTLTRWGATGWAWLPGLPEEALRIEAIVDGKVIGHDVADRLRPDLEKRGKRGGRCSFSVTFEGELSSDAAPILFAAGQHGSTELAGGKWARVTGYIDRLTRSGVIGWAWIPSEPDVALYVEAVLDSKVIGRARADHFRPDIAESGRGSGKYGFSFDFDVPIAGESIPQILVLGPGDPTVLMSPDRLAPEATLDPRALMSDTSEEPFILKEGTFAVEGVVEELTRATASGWAWMPKRPHDHVQIEAILDEVVIGRAVANRLRPDLAQCGKGTGRYGFSLEFESHLVCEAEPKFRALGSNVSGLLPIIGWFTSLLNEGLTERPSYSEPLSGNKKYELEALSKSSLFDAEYYVRLYPDIAHANASPLEHFYEFGFLEGRRPNPYFDPTWYLAKYDDVRDASVNPLVHYCFSGDLEGRQPSLLFNSSWYRKHYSIPCTENSLSHYLKNRKSCLYAPVPEFDVAHYARKYPDVVAARIDPFEHFISFGYQEGRTPSDKFDANFYKSRYLRGKDSKNPFLDFLIHSNEPGVFGCMPEEESSIPREVKRFTRPAPEFEELLPLPSSAPRLAKLLAYYLPQFHAFTENDQWWGKGFTEWANVPRGLPRFKGHYQPRIPRDLGFYSLDNVETMRRQAEMAKAGGVFGFVFYYYWFNGRRLLEKPVEAFLADSSVEMPFCLMWANENWTRRWDGADAEVLISQDYRLDDEQNLVANFARHFKDSRYIRIQGRPLLMIYRAGLIDDTKKTIARWRGMFEEKFNEDPLLVMAQTFHAVDPNAFGMDGAVEFPPHKLTQDMSPINTSIEYLDLEFDGKVYRYDEVVDASLKEPSATFPLIKTAVPSWDNDARRQGNGLVITESTPQKYQAWLGELIGRAVQNPFFGEPIVCVNAWNEWCEGAYLEPDLHYGAAYLNATSRAVAGKSIDTTSGRVLLVGHDCFPSGAQHLLLTIGRTLKSHYGVEISIVLLHGGKLESAYRELGPVRISAVSPALDAHLLSLKEGGFTSAILNTSASAVAVPSLKKAGIEVTMLVHELPRILREKGLTSHARVAAQQADRIVFPAPFVRDQYCAEVDLEREDGLLIVPQGMYQKIEVSDALRKERRSEFAVGAGDRLVIGMGYADMRKGFDLFLQVWRLVRKASLGAVHFCWVGDIDFALKNMMRDEISNAEATGTFHMAGFRKDVSSFLSAADAFILSSREDPFPSVVLEALYAMLPVMAFERSGGLPDVLRDHPLGHVVPFADTLAMADRLVEVMREGPSEAARTAGRDLIETQFSFPTYVWRLLKLAHKDLPEISVAVPNYNYARHMAKRLGSIFLQTQPVKEIMVLDDCSTDDSFKVISETAKEWERNIRLLPNAKNSGSVFKQWRKAAEVASGEFLWIAEADDLCAPRFLTEVIDLMRHDSTIRFAFSDSSAIDADGNYLWPSYKGYYSTVQPGALARTQIFDGGEFVERFLSVKNLILNVSAVVWRRSALIEAMRLCEADLYDFQMAGDWRLYLQALCEPGSRVGYCAEPLNVHRRHSSSVTHALDAQQHIKEIAACHSVVNAFFSAQGVRKVQDAYLDEVVRQLGE